MLGNMLEANSFKERVQKNLKNRGKKQDDQAKKAMQLLLDEEKNAEEQEKLRQQTEEEEKPYLANQYWKVPDAFDIEDLLKDY